MAENSKIEWTTHTFNPWRGCQKVSDGCKLCYAETLAKRYGLNLWGPSGTRMRTSPANWKLPLKWNTSRWICSDCGAVYRDDTGPGKRCTANVKMPFKRPNGEIVKRLCGGAMEWVERPRVFCASMADVFEDHPDLVPWRLELFDLIRQTPNLDWQILTKRPENIVSMIGHAKTSDTDLGVWLLEWYGAALGLQTPDGEKLEPPSNVWLGASVENQEMADKRIPELLKAPAVVRFLSCEPLLGPVDLDVMDRPWCTYDAHEDCTTKTGTVRMAGIDWVICGGESGAGARPMQLEWAQRLSNDCWDAGVPFFMKQLGGVRDKRHDMEQFPEGLRVREFPEVAR